MPSPSDLRYLILAVLVVLLGLFNSGLDDKIAGSDPPPPTVAAGPLRDIAYHYRKHTREERFYRCFGEMALGRNYDWQFLAEHRGDLGEFHSGMLGPGTVNGPVLPYRDYIAEYPPVNFPFIVAPSLPGERSQVYSAVLRLMLALLNVCALFFSLLLAVRLLGTHGEMRRLLLLSLVGALLLGPIMVTRLDPIALFFFVGALLAVTKDRPITSGLMLALATGAKIVPMFLIPFFSLHWWMKGEIVKSLRFTAASLGSLALIFLPPALIDADNFRALFRFHGERPIQVESSYASFLRLRELMFDVPVETVHSHGSWNLSGPEADFLGSVSKFLALGAVAGMLWLYRSWLSKSSELDELTREMWLLRACGATVLGLMFFSKVLSPQYLIWLWPWIFLAENPRKKVYPALCLLTFLLTQLITQPYASSMVAGEVAGTLLLAVRNGCLLGLFLYLARKPQPWSAPSPDNTGDWGWKTSLLPFALALTALLVNHQSRKLESFWTSPQAGFLSQSSYRQEFGSMNPNSPLPYRGYSGLEVERNRTFAWTKQREVVHFLPSLASPGPHIFELRVLHALHPDFVQEMDLAVNGHPTPFWRSEGEWPAYYTAWIPPEHLKSRGLNLVTLHTPAPVSPKSLGTGDDPRDLGMQVDWLSISVVDGFARFLAPPPESVLMAFRNSTWIARSSSSQAGWEPVEGGYWETASSESVGQVSPLWLYRPGDFSADFARLPVGSGWSEAGADQAGRPYRRLEGKGQLSLRLPEGPTILSFSVLKDDEGATGPQVRLSVNGSPKDLTLSEEPWETIYRVELEGSGGVTDFLFEQTGKAKPFGRLTHRYPPSQQNVPNHQVISPRVLP